MKDVYEVLRLKEIELSRVEEEVETRGSFVGIATAELYQ